MSLRLLFDVHLGDLARALRNRAPRLTIWRVGEPGTPPRDASDPEILRWCVLHDFVLVSRDTRTLEGHHAALRAEGMVIPGIIIANRTIGFGDTIELLELTAEIVEPDELRDTVRFLSSFA